MPSEMIVVTLEYEYLNYGLLKEGNYTQLQSVPISHIYVKQQELLEMNSTKNKETSDFKHEGVVN